MANDPELRQAIITEAGEEFFKYGFANITTNQIAEKLKISKKTLYRLFSSKDELLDAVLEKMHREMNECFAGLVNNDQLDILEKTRRISQVAIKTNQKFSPQFVRDLQRLEVGDGHQRAHECSLVYFEQLFQEGVARGVFRSDVNLGALLLLILKLQGSMDFDTMSRLQLSMQEAIDALINIIIEGILTVEGRERYHSEG